MNQVDATEQFVSQLTEHQNRLYGYIYSLLADHSRAADVLQETNLVLWRKIGEFQPDKAFLPWAFAIARFQVLAHLRDHKRDRCLLDSDMVELLADEAEDQANRFESLREMLRPCLGLLTSNNRDLIERRYFRGMSVISIAEAVKRSESAVKVALLRIRRQLAECVHKRMTMES